VTPITCQSILNRLFPRRLHINNLPALITKNAFLPNAQLIRRSSLKRLFFPPFFGVNLCAKVTGVDEPSFSAIAHFGSFYG
jgi:hypothetical protein